MTAERLLVVEPMTSAVTVLGVAAELGWSTAAAAWDAGDRRMPDPVRDAVDTIIRVDPNDEDALQAAVLAEHRADPFTAVLPGIEFYVATAARVAHLLGLPGLPVHRVDALRDKVLMRVTAAAGLRTPAFASIDGLEDLDAAAASVDFPAVFKPRDSAGSIHVSRVEDPDQLRAAYLAMVRDPRPDDVGRGSGRARCSSPTSRARGQCRRLRRSRRSGGALGHPQAALGRATLRRDRTHGDWCDDAPELRGHIDEYVARVCRALDVRTGPFHCELRLPDGRPTLIEMAVRLPGGQIVSLIEWTTGVQLPVLALTVAAGLLPGALGGFGRACTPYAGVHNFTAAHLDVVGGLEGADRLREREGVREVTIDVGPGDPVPEFGDFRCRLGQVLFVAESHQQLEQRRSELAAAVRFD